MPKQKIKQYEGKHILTYIHATKTLDMSLPSKHNAEPGRHTKLFRFHHYIDSIDVMART
jgi:hypothetical protein